MFFFEFVLLPCAQIHDDENDDDDKRLEQPLSVCEMMNGV